MTAIVPNEGEAVLLEAMEGKTLFSTSKLRLFVNNLVPGPLNVNADFTEFGTATKGYAPISVDGTGWGAAIAGTSTATDSTGSASMTYPEQTFAFTGTDTTTPVTVYGWYRTVTSTSGTTTTTKVVGAEAFPEGPQVVNASPDVIKVTLQRLLRG